MEDNYSIEELVEIIKANPIKVQLSMLFEVLQELKGSYKKTINAFNNVKIDNVTNNNENTHYLRLMFLKKQLSYIDYCSEYVDSYIEELLSKYHDK